MAEKTDISSPVPVGEEKKLRHIAFIMDGNGRWAKKRGLPRSAGHAAGAKTFRRIVNYCGDIGIECVTVYAFSTENWSRPEEEVQSIMKLFRDYMTANKNNIRMRFLGDLSRLDEDIRLRAEAIVERTKNNDRMLNVALNYGGRDELVHAFRRLAAEGKKDITEADISGALYTAGLPDPDLIVRTAGEMRLSNFLPWQTAYTEMVFEKTYWPDYDRAAYLNSLRAYSMRKRRFGNA